MSLIKGINMSLIKVAAQTPSTEQIEAYDNYRKFQRRVGTGALGILGGIYGGIGGAFVTKKIKGVEKFNHLSTAAGAVLGAAALGGLGHILGKAHDKRERELYVSGSTMNLNNY